MYHISSWFSFYLTTLSQFMLVGFLSPSTSTLTQLLFKLIFFWLLWQHSSFITFPFCLRFNKPTHICLKMCHPFCSILFSSLSHLFFIQLTVSITFKLFYCFLIIHSSDTFIFWNISWRTFTIHTFWFLSFYSSSLSLNLKFNIGVSQVKFPKAFYN